MHEVIIVGNGPAGISAALYTQRAGIATTIIGKDSGALAKADVIENYYGFENPITGQQLISVGIAQAQRLGVRMLQDEVVSIGFEDTLTVKAAGGQHKATCVILATGAGRTTPKIKGVEAFEGKGVSYCAVCDAFFYKGKDVAVLGCCDYALSEAMELLPIAKSVTVITNGAKTTANFPPEMKVIPTPITALTGSATLESVQFQDGSNIAVSGVFVAMGVAGSSELAKKLGAEVNGRNIVVDENMATNIPGLYAAGDCTGGMLQIAKAVYEGAKAGTEVVRYIRKAGKANSQPS